MSRLWAGSVLNLRSAARDDAERRHDASFIRARRHLSPMTDLDSRERYDALIDDLAIDARERADGAPTNDDCWDSVSAFVPELSGPVCERVLELSDSDPDEELVEHVTDARGSNDAEYRRAEAVTVLLQDVEARFAADE